MRSFRTIFLFACLTWSCVVSYVPRTPKNIKPRRARGLFAHPSPSKLSQKRLRASAIVLQALLWWKMMDMVTAKPAHALPSLLTQPTPALSAAETSQAPGKTTTKVILGSGTVVLGVGVSRAIFKGSEDASDEELDDKEVGGLLEEPDNDPPQLPASTKYRIKKLIEQDAMSLQEPPGSMKDLVSFDGSDTDAPLAWKERHETEETSSNGRHLTEVLETMNYKNADTPLRWREEAVRDTAAHKPFFANITVMETPRSRPVILEAKIEEPMIMPYVPSKASPPPTPSPPNESFQRSLLAEQLSQPKAPTLAIDSQEAFQRQLLAETLQQDASLVKQNQARRKEEAQRRLLEAQLQTRQSGRTKARVVNTKRNYDEIEDLGERAYAILKDLDMV